MSAVVFRTITAEDWRAAIQRARTEGAIEGAMMLAQIRAGAARAIAERESREHSRREETAAQVERVTGHACRPGVHLSKTGSHPYIKANERNAGACENTGDNLPRADVAFEEVRATETD